MEILKKFVGIVFVLKPGIVGSANINIYNQTKNEFVVKNKIIVLDGTNITDEQKQIIQYSVDKEDIFDIDVKSETGNIFVKEFVSKLLEKRNGTHTDLIIRDDIRLHDKENDLLYSKRINEDTKDMSFIENYWGNGASNTFNFNSPYKKARKFGGLSVDGGLSWYEPSDVWYFTWGSNDPAFDDNQIVDGHFGIKIKDTPALGVNILVKWFSYCDTISIFETSTKKIIDYAIEVY